MFGMVFPFLATGLRPPAAGRREVPAALVGGHGAERRVEGPQRPPPLPAQARGGPEDRQRRLDVAARRPEEKPDARGDRHLELVARALHEAERRPPPPGRGQAPEAVQVLEGLLQRDGDGAGALGLPEAAEEGVRDLAGDRHPARRADVAPAQEGPPQGPPRRDRDPGRWPIYIIHETHFRKRTISLDPRPTSN